MKQIRSSLYWIFRDFIFVGWPYPPQLKAWQSVNGVLNWKIFTPSLFNSLMEYFRREIIVMTTIWWVVGNYSASVGGGGSSGKSIVQGTMSRVDLSWLHADKRVVEEDLYLVDNTRMEEVGGGSGECGALVDGDALQTSTYPEEGRHPSTSC